MLTNLSRTSVMGPETNETKETILRPHKKKGSRGSSKYPKYAPSDAHRICFGLWNLGRREIDQLIEIKCYDISTR